MTNLDRYVFIFKNIIRWIFNPEKGVYDLEKNLNNYMWEINSDLERKILFWKNEVQKKIVEIESLNKELVFIYKKSFSPKSNVIDSKSFFTEEHKEQT